MKIAVIDSGLSPDYVSRSNKIHVISLTEGNVMDDSIGHGTAVISLLDHLVTGCDIFSIKIFGKSCCAKDTHLLNAIEYACSELEVNIIHMSNGVTNTDKRDRFEQICDKCQQKGIMITAGMDNAGRIAYPAVLKNVIGVYWDLRCKTPREYIYVENSVINILGYSGNFNLPFGDTGRKNVAGSSFVLPFITAKVAEYMQDGKTTLEEIHECLKKEAKFVINMKEDRSTKIRDESSNVLKQIKKVLIFPWNKEIETLVNNVDLFNYEIYAVCDIPQKGYTGKHIRNFCFHYPPVKIQNDKIESIDSVNWEADFDSVILGHMKKISNLLQKDMIDEIISRCLIFSKNLYAFDDLRAYEKKLSQMRSQGNHVFYFSMNEKDVEDNTFGGLYPISCPVVAICGTSPRQGKFTLQLEIQRRFRKIGYNIGQIGTEPTSFLLGMECAFPVGYESNIHLTPEQIVSYLNRELYHMLPKDIIFVGLQSQTIPYGYGNLGFLTFNQHSILAAVEPDAAILCVNFEDSMEYIRRSIEYLKSYFMLSVIALVLFPYHKERNGI